MMTSPAVTPRGKSASALHSADRESCQIVIAARIYPRHFRSLPADQGCAGLPAARGDAGDDRLGHGTGSSAPQAK